METINKSDLFPLLQKSKFVCEYEDNESEQIIIPTKYIFTEFEKIVTVKYKIIIKNNSDFYKIMDKLRYFMVDELPHEIYDYVIKNKPDLSGFKDFFFEELHILTQESDKIINLCAKKGFLNLIKLAFDNECKPDDNSCTLAALNNHLDCLKYLRGQGCTWTDKIIYITAGKGYFDCLKYIINNGSYDKWNGTPCDEAAKYNKTDCLKFLRLHDFVCTASTPFNAIKNGNLDCLKCLDDIAVQDNQNCLYSIHYSFECFKYLISIGCIHPATCIQAIENNKLNFLKYAIENGCPFVKKECLDMAITENNQEIIEYLESL